MKVKTQPNPVLNFTNIKVGIFLASFNIKPTIFSET